MDIKTNRWYLAIRMGESRIIPTAEQISIRGALMLIGQTLQEESGQFTRTHGDINIQLSQRPFLEQTNGFLDNSALDAAAAENNPRPGESREDYAQRLRNDDLPEAAIAMMLVSWFGEAPQESLDHLTLQQTWISDPMIQRLILLNSNNAEFEKCSREEYKRLKDHALATYPTMCGNMNWRTAD